MSKDYIITLCVAMIILLCLILFNFAMKFIFDEIKISIKFNCIVVFLLVSTTALVLFAIYTRDIVAFKYNTAITLMENGDYLLAINEFEQLGNYKDSIIFIRESRDKYNKSQYNIDYYIESNYQYGIELYNIGEYDKAIGIFATLKDYSDSEYWLHETMLKKLTVLNIIKEDY